MQLIMIKTYIRECNKNPVKVLSEMNRHPSHYWFTSLIGFFLPKGYEKAFHMYSKISDEGSIIALHNVAYCYEGGFGVKKNEGKAFELYLKLAKEGYPVAQYDVGRFY
ncbi:hypothetical protein Glove_162g78 [Diversispora epigaea]|uniref:HCP-like protein n=1 Tax=Diversispora epigaea TaxID=1348612 RepID=A0A397IVW7_9GLOM|nr:hypothetical protein Glove_162g78 [Diversispora epigaea]